MTHRDVRAGKVVVLALYRRLFDALERDGVAYCVWKNLDELPDALAGHGDIDLHVRFASRAGFLDALRAQRFVRIETHKGHPWVAHYYGFDEPSGTLCHLHCYFRLVTGESHIKQYVLPIERHLDALPAARNALGVREMHRWLQGGLYLFRRRIKLSCLPGALLYYRERAGYRNERALLERDGFARGERAPIGGWPATLAGPGSLRSDLVDGFVYRRRFRHWSRFAPFTTPLRRYAVVPLRALGKLLGWRKTLPLGLLVAVSGESSRTARMNREIDDWLGPALRLRAFHLPDLDERTTPQRLLRRCRRRRSTLRAALRSAANGSLVVCYGWHPSRLHEALVAAAGAPDTPSSLRRALERAAARIEEAAEPDVVLHPVEAAVSEADRGGATLIGFGADDSSPWRGALWRAIVVGQP